MCGDALKACMGLIWRDWLAERNANSDVIAAKTTHCTSTQQASPAPPQRQHELNLLGQLGCPCVSSSHSVCRSVKPWQHGFERSHRHRVGRLHFSGSLASPNAFCSPSIRNGRVAGCSGTAAEQVRAVDCWRCLCRQVWPGQGTGTPKLFTNSSHIICSTTAASAWQRLRLWRRRFLFPPRWPLPHCR